jgi:4-amino-4-deoxy-L-arabinose transferase-like glycosyltransferase
MLRKIVSRAVAASQRLRVRGGIVALTPPLVLPGIGSAGMYALAALVLPAFFFLTGLDAFPLRDNNEGLYAEIAREMLDGGSLIVPHLNGVPYIEKPPLLYWLCALSMTVFGITPAAARLASALPMYLACVGLFLFCRAHGNPRAGAFAAVGLASALPVALVSHVVLFDPLLTALVSGSLLCYLHGYLGRSRPAHRAAACLLALAVLEKGGLALALAGGVVGLFLLLVRDRAGWRRLFDPAALALLVLVAGVWHLAASRMQPGFAWFYFINEHLLRFLGQRLPDDYHHGPLWYYLPRMLILLLPWTPFLLLLAPRRGAPVRGNPTIVRFCQAAVLFPLLFFSLSAAKADYYLMVALPALALWLAIVVSQRLGQPDKLVALCWSASLALAALSLLVVPGAFAGWLPPETIAAFAAGAVVLAAAARRFYLRLPSARARELALLAVALCAMAAVGPLCSAAGERGARDSSVHIARILQARDLPAYSVFIYRDFEDMFSTLPFYLGRAVPIIDSASRDLQFGCATAPGNFCLGVSDFKRERGRGPVAVVLQAWRAQEFMRMAGAGNWRAEWVGEKMVLFSTPPAAQRAPPSLARMP